MRRPVALGSRVPQCPTFRNWNWRRMASTTSWEVGPGGLSMSRAPSNGSKGCMDGLTGSGAKERFQGGEDAPLSRGWGTGNAGSRSRRVTAASELAGHATDVDFG